MVLSLQLTALGHVALSLGATGEHSTTGARSNKGHLKKGSHDQVPDMKKLT